MGRITSGVGLVSGINSGDIIDQLMQLESRPKQLIERRIAVNNQQKLAYTDLQTRLTALRVSSTSLQKPSTFQNAKATSTNPAVLTATAAKASAVGTYSFTVNRLVTTKQSISAGVGDASAAFITQASTISMELGGGDLRSQTPLSSLNAGAGVQRGSFKLTDRAGDTAVIDLANTVSLDDVLARINTNLDISVAARVEGDAIVIEDRSGGTGSFVIADIGTGTTAADLGIAGTFASASVTGSDINGLSGGTALSTLNDGRGVRTKAGLDDLTITTDSGSWGVNLSTARTLADVIATIDTATGSQVQARLAAGGNGIELVDVNGGGSLAVAAANGSNTAADLGILGSAAGDTLTGTPLIAGLNDVLLASLKGGQGLALTDLTVTNRAGANATINLASARGVNDVLKLINDAGAGVKATLNRAGTGIALEDTTGGVGDLVLGGAAGDELGLTGTFDNTNNAIQGGNLQRQWVTENSLLANLNGGKGTGQGEIKFTSADGQTFNVDLTQDDDKTIGDVIEEINGASGGAVTARVNDNGDGILITDTTTGPGKLKIEDVQGLMAKNLRIAGEHTGSIDGSYEVMVELAVGDSLETVRSKINDAGIGVTANIINDGTAGSPFRLSLTSQNSGRQGRVVVHDGNSPLKLRTLVEAQDSAVFLGPTDGSAEPLLITSSTNQISGVIPGVSISLTGTSRDPVQLSITRDVEETVSVLEKFQESFNGLVDRIKEVTKFNPETLERGVLLGELTVRTTETEIYRMLRTVVPAGGEFRVFSSIGMKVTSGAKLEFDAEQFKEAYAQNPDSVTALFTTLETGLGYAMEKSINKLIDPVDGVITRQSKSIDDKNDSFGERIETLDVLLEQKRDRLTRQFANLESVLSGLQSQQQAISQITQFQPQNNRNRN